MSSNCSPNSRSCVAVAGLPLIQARLLPVVSTVRRSSKSVATSKPAASSQPCRAGVASNSAQTSQRSAPSRTTAESARAPKASCSASIKMDLPAPVSPVRTVKPLARSIASSRTITKSRRVMCVSATVYAPSFQCIFLRKVSK